MNNVMINQTHHDKYESEGSERIRNVYLFEQND